jgi:hypothetical protein
MGQVIQVNGDYNIKAAEGARITLDTGPGVGEVKVTGNLLVTGQTLTVDAQNLNVKDNVIILNYGETGSGVSLRYSGIQIDRGTQTDVSILYDEQTSTWLFAQGVAGGSLNYVDSKIQIARIVTDPESGGNLTINFDQATGGIIKVSDPATNDSTPYDYASQVQDINDIPNKKYVDDAIQNNPTFQIVTNNSRVIVTDKDVAGSAAYLASIITPTLPSGGLTIGDNNSGITIIADGEVSAQFFPNRVLLGKPGYGLEINKDFEITTENSVTNQNIYIRTQGTGKLQTNYGIQLESQGAIIPAYVTNSTVISAGQPGTGATGLYFSTSPTLSGEVISKSKALVFSMLF